MTLKKGRTKEAKRRKLLSFEQLTKEQQEKALDKCLNDLLQAILDGGLRFSDTTNGGDLQKRIDAACTQADSMQTPWFSHEYILDTCRADLESMARCEAEDALYSTDDQNIIHGIA